MDKTYIYKGFHHMYKKMNHGININT